MASAGRRHSQERKLGQDPHRVRDSGVQGILGISGLRADGSHRNGSFEQDHHRGLDSSVRHACVRRDAHEHEAKKTTEGYTITRRGLPESRHTNAK
jgi:hypothetical protein